VFLNEEVIINGVNWVEEKIQIIFGQIQSKFGQIWDLYS